MTRQRFFLGILFILILAACSGAPPTISPTAGDLATSIPAVLAVQPTLTSQPVSPPTQSPVPSPESETVSAAIEPGNAGQLVKLAQLGKGALHANPIYSPEGMHLYSPDGKWLAVPTSAGIYIYEAGSLQERFKIPTGTPFIAYSPDGRTLAVSERGRISLWDPASGKELGELPGAADTIYWELIFSPDGSRLAAVSWDSEIEVWSLAGKVRLFTIRGDRLRFSPDGEMAVVNLYGEKRAYLYEAHSGTLINQWEAHNAGFAPGGQLWLEDEESVRLVYVDLNQMTAPFEGVQPFFSADGTSMALFADGQISLFDPYKGRRVQTLEGSYVRIDGVLFSPDGLRLAGDVYTLHCPTCSEIDGLDRSLVIWQAEDGTVVNSLPHPSGWIGYSTDGSLLTAVGAESIQIIHTADDSTVDRLDGFFAPVAGLALSPDGKSLAAAYATEPYTLRFWDMKSGSPAGTLHARDTSGTDTNLAVAYSVDGLYLAVNGDLWDLTAGEQVAEAEQAVSQVTSCWSSSVGFAPQGNILATGCYAGQLDLWSFPKVTLQNRITGTSGVVVDLAFSPDGVYLAAAYGDPDYRVQVWQLPEAQPFFSLSTRHFTRVAYAQDGHLLVTVAANPDYEQYGQPAGYVQLWNAVNGEALLQLDIDDAVSAALSPDSQILATGSLDGTLRLWDATSGELLWQARQQLASIQRIAFTPDGDSLFSASQDGTLYQWGLSSAAP